MSWATVTFILGGVGVTCVLIIGAMLIGLALGTFMAALQVYGPRWAGRLVSLYVWFFRGVPILVLMFLFHYGLFSVLEALILKYCAYRFTIPPMATAIIVLGLTSAAYQSQIFKGAMLSINTGQFKGALALGMSRSQAIRVIILPQAMRIAIPAWSNEYSILLKDSAIAFVLGTSEIMARTKSVASTTHQFLLLYILAGVLYYILTWLGVRYLHKLYEKVRTPGLAEIEG